MSVEMNWCDSDTDMLRVIGSFEGHFVYMLNVAKRKDELKSANMDLTRLEGISEGNDIRSRPMDYEHYVQCKTCWSPEGKDHGYALDPHVGKG